MTRAFAALVAATLAAPSPGGQPPHRYVPPAGFVPDSATAVTIAVAVWTPIYGAAQIAAERPYHARLRSEVWTVEGTLRCGAAGAACVGGVAVAEIARRDARVLRVSHGL